MHLQKLRFLALGLAVALSATAGLAADNSESSTRKININQASATQLAFLPHVGIKAGERIVEYRKSHGPFGQPEELMEVKGIGEKLFAQLKPYLTLTGPTTLSAKVRLSSTRSKRPAGAKSSASNSVPVGKGR